MPLLGEVFSMVKSVVLEKSRGKSMLGTVEGEKPFREGLKDCAVRSAGKFGAAKRLLELDGVVGLLFESGVPWVVGGCCCWGRWGC